MTEPADDTARELTMEMLNATMRQVMSAPIRTELPPVSPYVRGSFGILMRAQSRNWNWRRVKRELRRFDAGKPSLYDLG